MCSHGWIADFPHKSFFVAKVLARVLKQPHSTVPLARFISSLKKGIGQPKESLVLCINVSIPDDVAISPTESHTAPKELDMAALWSETQNRKVARKRAFTKGFYATVQSQDL
jgi:hypothetical protein